MLSHYISKNQRDWDNWIPSVLMAYRGSTHSSTGFSPYFLLHGRDQVLPMDSMISSGRVRYDYDDNYASELLERLRRVYSDVYKNTEKANSERVKRYNKKTGTQIQFGRSGILGRYGGRTWTVEKVGQELDWTI
ncbi:hypothetical protein JTB14_038389 [Gonioctena quinquepunctata]|nr:hypothetical protein JTB14_038389 [Gonioctena quinquepunctata]